MTLPSGPLTPLRSIGAGAKRIFRHGLVMAAFEYRQAEEVRDAFTRHGVRFLFIGKAGAILLGFPDTTQDAVLFLFKSPQNGRATVAALHLSDDPDALTVRSYWVVAGWHPPTE